LALSGEFDVLRSTHKGLMTSGGASASVLTQHNAFSGRTK